MSLSPILYWVFGVVAILASYSTLFLGMSLVTFSTPTAISVSLGATLVLLLTVLRGSRALAERATQCSAWLAKIGMSRWLVAMLVLGVATRIVWIVLTGTTLKSDGMTYYTLARTLFERGFYADALGGRAYWPPGLALLYYAVFAVFGVHAWIPTVVNLALFAMTLWSVSAICTELLDEHAARIATLLVTVWPNFVFSGGAASKEMLVTATLSASLWLFLRSQRLDEWPISLRMSALCGIMLGVSSLTQPSMMLFPLILACSMWMRGVPPRTLVVKFVVILLGLAATIAPWTLRNYGVLKQFVPISTNGGDVFYRANNPLATGGYIPRGERDVRELNLGEVEQSRAGYDWGKAWIRENPGAFLALAIRKQILFLGDDAIGAYESLKRAEDRNTPAYIAAKAFSNGFWLLLWVMILIGWNARKNLFSQSRMAIMLLPVLYLLAIDSVYESGGRHHVPLIAVLSILASVVVVRSDHRDDLPPVRA